MPPLYHAGLLALTITLQAVPASQTTEDPAIHAAVERYYKALEAEDVSAYLALWSPAAVQRPQPVSLKFLFDAIDERFSEIQILRTEPAGNRLRVRISLRRERTRPRPGGTPVVTSEVAQAAITFVREADDWKVFSEGSPPDDLAANLVAAATADEREALLASNPDLLDRSLVLAVARIADQAAGRRQYDRAQTLYERMLELARRTGSRAEEGLALQNIGNAHYFQRQFAQALQAYEQRRVLEEARGDDAAMALAVGGVATVQYSIAEYTEALKRYRLALAIHERLDDRPATATALISTANVRYIQGDYSGAIRDYSRSRDLYREMGDTGGDMRALDGLGRTYSAQGDYTAALSAFAAVLDQARKLVDRARQATTHQSVADVHLRLGNVDAARMHYEESRDQHNATGNPGGAGRVWQGLGMTELLAGRFDRAEEAYRRSATICGGATDAECVAHAVVGLAFAQSAQEKYAEAIPSYQKAIAEFTALGARDPAARAQIGLSQALTGAIEIPSALAAAAIARQEAVGLSLNDVLWRALTAEARALRKNGAARDAVAAARAAAGVVEQMETAALSQPATAIPSDASSALATLAVLFAETGDAAGAFAAASRMRGIDLRNGLAVNEREIARGMTAEERDQERVAATELLSLLAQVRRERGLPKPDAARIKALDERIAAAGAAREAWMRQLYDRLPELRIWRGLAPLPDREQVLAALPAGTVLLEFVVDDEDLLVLTASGGSEPVLTAHVARIRRRALVEHVTAMLQPATLRDPALWRKTALEVSRLIPEDVASKLASATRVVVVPHDIMWRVPFEALPIGDGYLGDRAQVIHAGSHAAILRAGGAKPASLKTLLAVSAPELAPAARERLHQTAPGWVLRGAEAGVRETAAFAPLYEEDGTVLSGQAATEAAVRARAQDASILHVAAPFRINGASPLFSPILLAGEATSAPDAANDDGALEAREVMNLSLAGRAAILTDGTSTSMLDGAAGAGTVQWAWLAAGVPSLALARWPPDPKASDVLIAELHRRLRAGSDPVEALQHARRAIRKHREWSAPFYWAGWMVFGR